jgi:hypothetical protein
MIGGDHYDLAAKHNKGPHMRQYELGGGMSSDNDEAEVDSDTMSSEDSDGGATVSSEDSLERTLK